MRAPLEVADVFRDGEARFLSEYGHTLSREQRQVLRAVIRCRTAQLGGHVVQQCDDCGHQRIQYNSCRNRHCPKCQAMARAAWLEKRESELLPVPYFHVVFTLPHELGPLALQNKRVVYRRQRSKKLKRLQKTLTGYHHQRPARLVDAKVLWSSTSCPRHGRFR